MIPDFAGRLFEVVKLDWGLHLWTDNNWEFILSERVLVTTTDAEGLQQSEVEVDVEPGPVPEPLVGLEGARITQVLVSRAGDLGIQLTCPTSHGPSVAALRGVAGQREWGRDVHLLAGRRADALPSAAPRPARLVIAPFSEP